MKIRNAVRMVGIGAAVLSGWLGAGALSAQTVIYVNAAAAPAGNGASWATAFRELQSALDAAASIPPQSRNVEIWVSGGRYLPTRRSNPLDPRSVIFEVPDRTRIIGGFAGTEARLEERRFAHCDNGVGPGGAMPALCPNETVFDGDLAGDDVFPFQNQSDNAYTLVSIAGPALGVGLDGITIRGGNGRPGIDGAGAITVGSSAVTMLRCTIFHNRSGGGAMFITGASGTLISQCRFLKNQSPTWGAAIMLDGSPGNDMDVGNSTFVGNAALESNPGAGFHSGGAILADNRRIQLSNCTFVGNSTGTYGGAVYLSTVNGSNIYNCLFWDNTAGLGGSSIWTDQGEAVTLSCSVDVPVQGPGPRNTTGTFARDPLYVAPTRNGPDGQLGTPDDNVAPAASSFCVDAGDMAEFLGSSVSFNTVADVDGRRRLIDATGDGSTIVDIGAREVNAPPYTPVVYVNANLATGRNDGSDWANAFRGPLGLRNALAFISSQSQGAYTQVWVASGLYKPSPPLSMGGSRSDSFSLRNNLEIYGGFAGTETTRSQRNPEANVTVLSGDLNGDDTADLNLADNSFHVVEALGVGTSAMIDGVSIVSGRADGPVASLDHAGGGLICVGAAPSITACTFEAHTAQTGGALYVYQASSPRIVDCLFQANRSQNFQLAAGLEGGAAIVDQASAPRFLNCRFWGNQAAAEGGAVSVRNASTAAFIRCAFVRNQCGLQQQDRSYGGAVYAAYAEVDLVLSQVLGNTSAVHDGGVHVFFGPARIIGCTFVGNQAQSTSSALAFYSSSLTLRNSVFVSNRSQVGEGSAIFMYGDAGAPLSASIANGLFSFNGGDGNSTESAQLRVVGPSGVSISQSSIQGWTGSLGGLGNNGLDPRFLRMPSPGADGVWGTIDDDYGDLRLAPSSPAIDSGDALAVPPDTFDLDLDNNTTEALPLDLAGNPRFFDHPGVFNSGSGSPPVDRGAYEFIPPVCPPPNDDGVRNWVSSSGGSFTDINNWLPCVPDVGSHLLFDSGAASVFEVMLPPSPAVSSRSLRVRSGDVTFTGAAAGSTLSLTDTSQFSVRVGDTAGRAATLRLGRGAGPVGSSFAPTLTADEVVVGDAAGSSGLLDLADAATVRPSGQLTIGNAGTGLAFIRGGSLLRCFNVGIGEEPGSRGDLTIDGPGSILSTRSSLVVKRGSLNVSGGGQVAFRSAAGIVSVFKSGELTGTPTIPGDLECFGTLSPGEIGLLPVPGTPSIGTLRVSGDYFQFGEEESDAASTGILRIEVGGTGVSPAPEFDRLIVDGAADLGSGLASDGTTIIGGGGLVVSAIDGLAADIPPVGADPGAFRVRFLEARGMTPAQFTTRFGVALLPAVPGREDVFFTLIYNPPGVPFGAVELGLAGFAGGDGGLSVDPTLPVIDPALVGEPTASALGDLNNDGLDDLVVVYRRVTSSSGTSTLNNNAYIFINQGLVAPGGAIFGPSIVKNLPNGPLTLRTTDVAIADIDDNGSADIAFSHDVGDDGVPGFVTFIANSGGGTAASFVTVAGAGPDGRLRLGAGRGPSSLVVANLKDRDAGGVGSHSRPELAIANRVDATVQVFELATAEAGAAFAYTAIVGVGPIPTGQAPVSMSAAGVDSDNGKRSDLLIANQGSNSVTVIPGGSTGAHYSHGTTFDIGVGSRPKVVLSSRLAGSGDKASFVTINGGTIPGPGQEATDPGSVSVVVKTGGESVAASYQPSVDLPVGLNPFEAAVTDLDGDGDLDVSVLTNVGTVMSEEIKLRVLRNDTIVTGSPGSSPQVTFATSGDEVVNPLAVFARSGRIVPGTPDASEGIVIVSGTGEGGPVNPEDPATYFRGGIYPLVPTTRPPTCLADFNADGNLDPDDLGDYINCYFSTPPCDRADITGDGGVDPDDLGDFINAYFGGC